MVIGRDAYLIDRDDALSHISGYFTANDISEREFQKNRGGQFVKGKSLPGAGPIGPYLIPADDISDPNALDIEMKLNGDVMQSSNTSDMIFDVAEIVSNMSQYMRLEVGDIILTGTPEGVALGMEVPRFVRAGDVLEATVAGMGTQRTKFV